MRLTSLGDVSTMPSPESNERERDQPALSALDRRTIAVLVTIAGIEKVLLGQGNYHYDDDLGNVLRIVFPAEVDCEFLVVENRWKGQILSGESLGCDFSIRFDR